MDNESSVLPYLILLDILYGERVWVSPDLLLFWSSSWYCDNAIPSLLVSIPPCSRVFDINGEDFPDPELYDPDSIIYKWINWWELLW